MLPALAHKLLRDLRHLSGQVITIALVVACGISCFVALRGSFASLKRAQDRTYHQQHFADLFVQLERAPESVRGRIETLPGVARAESRIVQPIIVLPPGGGDPLRGTAVSLPGTADDSDDAGALNRLRLSDGRLPAPDHDDEAILLEVFARARGLSSGSRLDAVVSGRLRHLRIVGLATSPEYILATAPGALSTDPGRFPVVWMSRESLASAFALHGAFNNLVLSLRPLASPAGVQDAVDRELEAWGGRGALMRSRQPSHQVLEAKMLSLMSMGTFLPLVFLAVAALLVNLVLSRLVLLQRPEIATLKALGYSNIEIGRHYLFLVLIVVGLGAAIGLHLGALLGDTLIHLYARYFRLPQLRFLLDARDAVWAASISFLSAVAGAFTAVRQAVALPPAEAMRPPTPARYHRSLLDRLHLARLLGPTVHMIVRELQRQPLRTLSSALAVAAATGLSVVGGYYYDGIGALFESQFFQRMREDVAVSFLRPVPDRVVRDLSHLPGVLATEGLRVAPVRFRAGSHHREATLWGYGEQAELRALRTSHGQRVALPPEGMIVTDMLARVLQVRVGDTLDVDLLEGSYRHVRIPIVGLVDEPFGLQGHMRMTTLSRLLSEGPQVSMVVLRTDSLARDSIEAKLRGYPGIVDITRRMDLLHSFRQETGNMILTMAFVIALFAATITIGVVYNNARVALSVRGRDLASLRVLGFTRGEISLMLVGEQLFTVLASLPIGLWFGKLLVGRLAAMVNPETYRLPMELSARSYTFATLVTLAAALVCALLVRRRLDHLDLIAVLKTRE